MHPSVTRLLLLVLLAGGCEGVVSFEDSNVREEVKTFAKHTDAWAEEELLTTRHEHAHRWLSSTDNALYEGDPEQIEGLIERLYDAGAQAVWFTGIEKIGERNVSAALAVEMPRNETARLTLLRIEAQHVGADEPNPDLGQKYLGFAFD